MLNIVGFLENALYFVSFDLQIKLRIQFLIPASSHP